MAIQLDGEMAEAGELFVYGVRVLLMALRGWITPRAA